MVYALNKPKRGPTKAKENFNYSHLKKTTLVKHAYACRFSVHSPSYHLSRSVAVVGPVHCSPVAVVPVVALLVAVFAPAAVVSVAVGIAAVALGVDTRYNHSYRMGSLLRSSRLIPFPMVHIGSPSCTAYHVTSHNRSYDMYRAATRDIRICPSNPVH